MTSKSIHQKIKASHQGLSLLVDLVMLLILTINLLWLVFDSFFATQLVKDFFAYFTPDFFAFYNGQVHPNFLVYDQIFIAIYLTELFSRWAIAIHKKTYYRWFFYPIANWYDVLGCIPVGPFRWLRLLRVAAILYRLQKYKIIDTSQWAVVQTVQKYLEILTEEISDRVVVNVLEGVQGDIRSGHPIVHRITHEVVDPHRAELLQWLSNKVTEIIQISYEPNRVHIKSYLNEVINHATENNTEVARIQKIPVIGPAVVDAVEAIVMDLIYQSIDRVMQDVSEADNYQVVDDIAQVLSTAIKEEDSELNQIIMNMIDQGIEVIKEEVNTKQWAIKYGHQVEIV